MAHEPAFIQTSRLIRDLETLMLLAGQADEDHALARRIAAMLDGYGFTTSVAPTPTPVVVAQRSGRAPFTLVLYHHYDLAPTGPWRLWHQEPFRLSERDGILYGRGVAAGLGPLVAQLSALSAVIENDQELPCNIVVVVEGEHLRGSPSLASLPPITADAVLAVGGDLDARGIPYCYTGGKGYLQLALSTDGARISLATGMAASVVNPAWRLVWALAAIKNEQEEILIDGFYDSVVGPTREESRLLRTVQLDEAGRHAALGTNTFVAGLSGSALAQAEATLPTCNVGAIIVEPDGTLARIPTHARARIDFTLVAAQHPDDVFEQTCAHIAARGMEDVTVTRVPGGYPAPAGQLDAPFVVALRDALQQITGATPTVLPCAPLQLPLAMFCAEPQPPVAVVGCAPLTSACFGPNEHVALGALVRHGQLLIETLYTLAPRADART